MVEADLCHKGFPCECFCHRPGVRTFAACECPCQRCPECGANYTPTYRFTHLGVPVTLVPPE